MLDNGGHVLGFLLCTLYRYDYHKCKHDSDRLLKAGNAITKASVRLTYKIYGQLLDRVVILINYLTGYDLKCQKHVFVIRS